MSEELVTIGGQQFIFDKTKGWIDKKTKAPANENLLKLLNTVSPNRATKPINDYVEAPVEENKAPPAPVSEETQSLGLPISQSTLPKVKTKKINGVDPIVIGGERYVYTNKGWVDEKTKSPIPEKLKALFDKLVPAAESMGAIGAIEAEKIQKKDKEKIKRPQQVIKPKINKMFVKMIVELASIDAVISSRLQSVASTKTRAALDNKENTIESITPTSEMITPEAEQQKGGSSLAKIGGIVAITALLATQFDPLYEQIKALWDMTEKSAKYINGFASQINGLLEWFNLSKPEKVAQSYVTSNDPILEQKSKESAYVSAIQPTNNTPPLLSAKPQLNQQGPVMGKSTPKPMSKNEAYVSAVSKPTAGTPAKPNLVSKPSVSTPKQVEATKQSAYVSAIQPKKADAPYSPMRVKPDKVAISNGVPKGDLHALRRWLQAQGFRTSEQKGYDRVGKHSKNSKHYSGEAIDVNWGSGVHEATDPVAGPKFDALAAQLKAAGYGVIWRAKGHYGHLHVDTGGSSQIGGGLSDMISDGGEAIIQTAQDSWKALVKFMKAAGTTDTQFRKVGSNRSDAVERAASYRTKKIIESKNKKKAPVVLPELPNLNTSGGTIKLPSSSSNSKDVVNQYLKYFET